MHDNKNRLIQRFAADEELVENILEGTGEAILFVDCDEAILLANAAAEQLLDLPAADGTAVSLHGRCYPADADEGGGQPLDCPFCAVLASGQKCRIPEIRFAQADGRFLRTSLTCVPDVGSDGVVRGALVFIRDISERKKLERELVLLNEELEQTVTLRTNAVREANENLSRTMEQLQSAKDQLVHSEKMASIGQLAAGVAHEINNPVSFIKTNIMSLEENFESIHQLITAYEELRSAAAADPGTEAIRTRIEAIREDASIEYLLEDIPELLADSVDGADRIRDIVTNLRSFARTDSQRREKFQVNDCIDGALKILNNELKYRCTVHKELGELPEIVCSSGQLSQVFMNLVGNACHALPEEGGDIRIRSRLDGENVVVTVADGGSGIDPEHLTRLFDPFFTTKEVGKGTGLGLSIVHGIIEEHEGRIEVDSELGVGTTFTVSLPANTELEEVVDVIDSSADLLEDTDPALELDLLLSVD